MTFHGLTGSATPRSPAVLAAAVVTTRRHSLLTSMISRRRFATFGGCSTICGRAERVLLGRER
jgi:hypothetical protein